MRRATTLLLLSAALASLACGVPPRAPRAPALTASLPATSSLVDLGYDLDGVREVARPHVGQAFRASVPERIKVTGSTQGSPMRLRVEVTGQAAIEEEIDGYAELSVGLRAGDVLAVRVVGGPENGVLVLLWFEAMTRDSPGVSVEQEAFAVVSRALAPGHLSFAGDPCLLSLNDSLGLTSTNVAAGVLHAAISERMTELVLSCANGESCMALRTKRDCAGDDDVQAGGAIRVPLDVRERTLEEARRQLLDAFTRLSSRCASRAR